MMDVTQAKAMPVLVPADLGLVRERAAALGLTGTDAKVCLICAEVTMPTLSRAPSPCQQYGPYLFRLSRVQELFIFLGYGHWQHIVRERMDDPLWKRLTVCYRCARRYVQFARCGGCSLAVILVPRAAPIPSPFRQRSKDVPVMLCPKCLSQLVEQYRYMDTVHWAPGS